MVGCAIRNCKSKSKKSGTIRFFAIPKKESVAKEWLRYCGPKTTTKHGRVCSNHFAPSDFMPLQHIFLNESPRKVRQLRPGAVPTLLLDDKSNQNTASTPIEEHSIIEDISSNMKIHSRPEDNGEGKFREQLKKVAVPSIFKVIKVTSGGVPKFVVQNMESLEGLKLVKVKKESVPADLNVDPPSEEEVLLSFDGDHNASHDQSYEDLIPLSAHPVPLSDSPDPLCDIKVKVENETGGDGTVGEGDRPLKGLPARKRVEDGKTLRAVQPPTADLIQTRKTEEKIQKITQQRDRARASLHNVRKTLRRRNAKVAELRAQVATLRRFVSEHHGNEVVEQLMGNAAKSNGKKIQISGVKKDKRMKEANRQLLIIERDDGQNSPDVLEESSDIRQMSTDFREESPDIRQKSPHVQEKSPVVRQKSSSIGQKLLQSTSPNRRKSSVRGKIINKSDIRQKSSVASEPDVIIKKYRNSQKCAEKVDISKNRLLLIEHIPENSFGTQPTLQVRQKSSPVKTKSVDTQTGNTWESDIRQNDGIKRVVIHPNLVIPQEKSSDIPQHTQIGNKLKSDIRQNDGLKRVVIYPHLAVRQGTSSDISQDPQITNKRTSEIRQNDEKRRVVIHPHLVVRQEMSSDLSQTSVGHQRKALVIQIDGMQNAVIPHKLVRIEDNNIG